jgi:putative addiction module killer protein
LATIGDVVRVVRYVTEDGRDPFGQWFGGLTFSTRARIQARLDRIELGNFGDHRNLAGGISEFRIDFGPGYRIYFGRDGEDLVLLLAAGTKARQSRDIQRARALWRQYLQEKSDAND